MYNQMEYLVIGSAGFAQYGDPDQYQKAIVEGQVVMDALRLKHPIPKEFQGVCRFRWKRFPYDDGSYHEAVLEYNDRQVLEWELDDEEKHDRFWEFANLCEDFGAFAEDTLLEVCQSAYAALNEAVADEKSKSMRVVSKNESLDQDLFGDFELRKV